MSMQYRLWFLQKMDPKSFIQSVANIFEQQDMNVYASELGELYLFQLHDGFIKKTILKNESELKKFLKWYNKEFSSKITKESLKGGFEFTQISKINPLKEKYATRFMELENQDIFHFKALDMESRNEAKRWYDKICFCCYDAWENCQIIITEQGIIQKVKKQIDDFLLFTREFKYQFGLMATGEQFGIQLSTCHRKVMLKALNCQGFFSFLYYLKQALSISDVKKSRFEASSLVRFINKVDFIVDAENYFKNIAYAIQAAKEQIFMCGWWISPELPLIRPYNPENYKYRLDRLLKRKAQQGVRIYILVFNNPPVIPNDSAYTERTFRNLHDNIKILSHPCDIIPGLWSHHEKAVVIDQKVGFMGGLDVCYGRYDAPDHPINSSSEFMYPGIEYNNNRLKDFENVSEYTKDALSRKLPRMPWHDVALKLQGRVVTDLSNHFIEYWNNSYLQNLVIEERQQEVRQIDGKEVDFKAEKQYHSESKIYPHNKTTDNLMQKPPQLQKKQKRKNIPVSNNPNQTGLGLLEVLITKEKERARHSLQMLIKDTHNKLKSARDPSKIYNLILSTKSIGLLKLEEETWKQRKKRYPDHCQLLRSASQWSIGLQDQIVERSIQNAYLSIIDKAKTHIYIENQFFISAKGNHDSYVRNQIANALFNRVRRAISNKQKFKVIVFMPLLPGMEGEINEDISMSLRLILHWQYQTICIGEQSLLGRIKKLTQNPQQYIQFFSLRQHGILNGKPVTQLIYIHTKLMIVDDEVVICGSANINDRSQQGDRDSELALIVTEGNKIKVKINNKQTLANEKAHNLRIQLYCEHFGLTPEQCEDPLSGQLAAKISERAKKNTEGYRQLFGCAPDDTIKKLSEVKDFVKVPSVEIYKEKCKMIKGHVVEFPLKFLSEEELSNYDPEVLHDLMS